MPAVTSASSFARSAAEGRGGRAEADEDGSCSEAEAS